ncbi:MAG: hypothetical protein Q8N18_09790 [Opitutaceae bacterium]|nr:hypothetical protein [Opitutaceae bacterium]
MKSGEVVIARLWQADDGMKLGPAILLCRLAPFGDWLVCGVSSQVRHHVPDFDELIGPDADDFVKSGLRQPSLIRLGFLGTVTKAQVGGDLGEISPARLQRLRQNLSRLLQRAEGE